MAHANPIIDGVGLVLLLLLAAVATSALARRLRLPFSVLLVLAGIVLGQAARLAPEALAPLSEFHLSAELILFVFLPTLVFESAFHLEARQLRDNLVPILALAIPGLLISTSLIGAIVWFATDLSPISALLLGAILSATDPVAVIALFQRLGAPARLTVLVEGESLFNDATAIVATQVLVAIALAGALEGSVVLEAGGEFLRVFLGGSLVGWLLALIAGLLLGQVDDEPFIEISLVVLLAFGAFLAAEHLLHVSGVMAVVVAAITLGGWGRTKITPAVRGYLDHFWGYLSQAANALIFLLVGLQIDPLALAAAWQPLAWVIVAMLISRALVVYGVLPLISRLPGAEPIERRYKLILYWGGLRGAIALALALSLAEHSFAQGFVTLVTGAVLFTLLLPGLSIEWLVHRLGLDHPPVADRLAAQSARVQALHQANAAIPELAAGGWLPRPVVERLDAQYQRTLADAEAALAELRARELTPELEQRLILLAGLSQEATQYYRLFGQGQLSEAAYRDLIYTIARQSEALRQGRPLPAATLHPAWRLRARYLREQLLLFLHLPGLARGLHDTRSALDFQRLAARHRVGQAVIAQLEEMARDEPERAATIAEVTQNYQRWRQATRQRLQRLALQHPRFVRRLQERLAQRQLIHLQKASVAEQVRSGALPAVMAERLDAELGASLHALRDAKGRLPRQAPAQLLRNLAQFSELPETELERIVAVLEPRTLSIGQPLVEPGDGIECLYLLADGIAAATLLDERGILSERLLYPGDFFGEQVLLDVEPPLVVESRAHTECELYLLHMLAMEGGCGDCAELHQALETARRVV